MTHPWRILRDLTDWLLVWATPAKGRAQIIWASRTIIMSPALLQAERRSALAHELEHMERGPFPRHLTAREEEACSAGAARKLISVRDLGEALAWSRDPAEVAEELWVDIHTVEARMRHLHPSEVHYLRRRLAHLEEDPS